MFKIIISVIAVAIVGLVGFMLIDPNLNANNAGVSQIIDDVNTFKITLTGEVSKPGTYSLTEGVTMGEAITAAGGLTTNGDTLSFFEDVVLEKGGAYYISGIFDNTDVCNTTPIKKVNINQGNVESLTEINGISPTIANAIVDYRTTNGIFDTLEEIMEVYGVGNATYTKLRNYIILHE